MAERFRAADRVRETVPHTFTFCLSKRFDRPNTPVLQYSYLTLMWTTLSVFCWLVLVISRSSFLSAVSLSSSFSSTKEKKEAVFVNIISGQIYCQTKQLTPENRQEADPSVKRQREKFQHHDTTDTI